MAQWLTNPTRNHEGTGLIPGLAQWAKDLHHELWCRSQTWLGSGVAVAVIRPLAWKPPYAAGAALEKPKEKKKYILI